MDILLCDSSALEYWRQRTASVDGVPITRRRQAPSRAPSPSELGFALSHMDAIVARPTHVLVSSHVARRQRDDVACHVFGGILPARSAVKLFSGVYVASPMFCFARAAAALSLVETIQLGFELCGTYADYREFCSCYDMPQACGLDDLRGFLEQASGLSGLKKARRAIRHVAEGAASPKEAALVILLCLPLHLGGYGLPKPLLNHRIDMTRGARLTSGSHYYVCDLYWPEARLAVEYDSDEFHVGPERIARDSRRRNALGAMGVSVITVTWRQMRDAQEFARVAHSVAKRLGIYLRSDRDCPAARAALRRKLIVEPGREYARLLAENAMVDGCSG